MMWLSALYKDSKNSELTMSAVIKTYNEGVKDESVQAAKKRRAQ